MKQLGSDARGPSMRVSIAVSRYNETVTRGLLRGALEALAASGIDDDDVTVAHVPGALELALAADALARAGAAAVVVLGAVIRGQTDHYRHVCEETTRACGAVALARGVPVGFGVLTCETLVDATVRAAPTPKNKGREAALAAVETARLLAAIRAGAAGRGGDAGGGAAGGGGADSP